MSKIKIYVIAHKKASIPKKDGYNSLLVGKALGNHFDGVDYCDDDGDNISEKNKSYCELTGIYWIWKNDDISDYVGICHYRRYFTDQFLSMRIDKVIDIEEVDKLLKKYDIIVPNAAVYSDSIMNSVRIAPNINDLRAVGDAISVEFPEYKNDYEVFLKGNKYYPYNMFIMKRDDFNKYCEWLFTILTRIENDYGNPYTDNYRIRLFGFLSERLLYVWIKHNYDKKKIKELKVLFTEENIVKSNYHFISNKIRDMQFWFKNSNAKYKEKS